MRPETRALTCGRTHRDNQHLVRVTPLSCSHGTAAAPQEAWAVCTPWAHPAHTPHTRSGLVAANCGKCGNDRAYYQLLQIRSADEPMTTFFKCTACGLRWRED